MYRKLLPCILALIMSKKDKKIIQGHRTYPAFVHFLCSITCFALYIAVVAIKALVYAFYNPFAVVG